MSAIALCCILAVAVVLERFLGGTCVFGEKETFHVVEGFTVGGVIGDEIAFIAESISLA